MRTEELIHTAYYAAGFLALFALGELLYHVVKLPVEITRKFVHLFTGLICLSFPFVLETHWSVLILTLSFVIILVASMKFKLLKSINAVERSTTGSFLFPIVIYVMFWIYTIYGMGSPGTWGDFQPGATFRLGGTIFFFLPILILSVSDPLAALCGKRWPKGKYTILNETKTLVGSSAFFSSAFILSFAFVLPNVETIGMAALISVSIAAATTLSEGISQRGFDNLFIPVAAALVLILFLSHLRL